MLLPIGTLIGHKMLSYCLYDDDGCLERVTWILVSLGREISTSD